MVQNDIFHEKRHTRSFLKSFKWFQAILTSYYISHRLPHKPNHGLGLRQGRNSENLQKWVWMLKTIFFMKKRHTRSFLKSFKWFQAIWQVTIFHTRLPHKPNHGLGLRQGRNSENLQKWIWLAWNDFFRERRLTRSFLQSFKWFKSHFDKLPYFTLDFPTNQIMDWDLEQGWNSENLKKWVWMVQNDIFHEKRHTRIIFEKFQVISSNFDKLLYFTPDFPTNQIMDWDLDKGEFWKLTKISFEWLKTIFFMKKGIRDHFWKVSSDFKQFWQVTIFHTRLPHKPNHGLGLRQGRNSENLQKWIWLAWNDFFSWKKAYAIIFAKFQVI